MTGDEMRFRLVTAVIIVLAATSPLCMGLEGADALSIYLPREIAVDESALTLGRVSVIRGEQELVAKAADIALGRISVPGQEVVIDRNTILSRLASEAIDSSDVSLTGAEQIRVRQNVTKLGSDDFVKIGVLLLEETSGVSNVAAWEAMKDPQELALAGAHPDIAVKPRLVGSSSTGCARVEVDVFSKDERIATRRIDFQPQYRVVCLVATCAISAGETISEENTRVEHTLSSRRQATDARLAYGCVARRAIAEGAAIEGSMVEVPRPPVVIERNENVVIRIERPGFLVTAIGQSLQQARPGDLIKVKNVDSQRVILARVTEDGTVEPVF
jgi:flagella basal body P-ring formation protein FlgA